MRLGYYSNYTAYRRVCINQSRGFIRIRAVDRRGKSFQLKLNGIGIDILVGIIAQHH